MVARGLCQKHNVAPEARRLEIGAEYNARNRKELMLKYNISLSQFTSSSRGINKEINICLLVLSVI